MDWQRPNDASSFFQTGFSPTPPPAGHVNGLGVKGVTTLLPPGTGAHASVPLRPPHPQVSGPTWVRSPLQGSRDGTEIVQFLLDDDRETREETRVTVSSPMWHMDPEGNGTDSEREKDQ